MRKNPFIWQILRAALLYSALTIFLTWPLILNMGNSIIGELGDNIYFVWMIGWFKKAIFDLGTNPFNIWFLNYPEGWNLAYNEFTPLQLAIALPFSLIGSSTFAYNMAMMISFSLSGITMYLWVRDICGDEGPALLAGAIYAFVPYHFAHFIVGHLNLMGTQWFPLYFWGFFNLLGVKKAGGPLSEQKIRWKSALLAGISLGLIGLTSQYYLYMTLIISAILLIGYLVLIARNKIFSFIFWKNIFIMGLISLPLVVLTVFPYINLSQQGGLQDRSLDYVRRYAVSASPNDYLLPSTDHFLWGSWIGDHFNRDLWIECTLYIGFISAILIVIALVKRKSINLFPLGWLLLIGGATSFLLSLGPDLRWENEFVIVSLPEFLRGILGRNRLHFPLPGYYLYLYFPYYAKIRVFARYGIFFLLFSSFSAGMGSLWLFRKIKRSWKLVLFSLLLGLIWIDYYPGPYTQFSTVQPRPVDLWLAKQPGQGALIQFPFEKLNNQTQVYYTLFNEKPYVGAYYSAFASDQYLRIYTIMEGFPDEASIDALRQLGVEFVLVDVDEYTDIELLKKQCEELGLKYLVQIDDQIVLTPNQDQE